MHLKAEHFETVDGTYPLRGTKLERLGEDLGPETDGFIRDIVRYRYFADGTKYGVAAFDEAGDPHEQASRVADEVGTIVQYARAGSESNQRTWVSVCPKPQKIGSFVIGESRLG